MSKINLKRDTKTAVNRYVAVRFSHFTDKELESYILKVKQELVRRNKYPDEYPNSEQEYQDKVKAFFARNQDFLTVHEKASKSILDKDKQKKRHEAKVSKLFKLKPEKRDALIKKHQGNVNAILAEV